MRFFHNNIHFFSKEDVGQVEIVLFVYVLLPFYCFNHHVFRSLNKFSQRTLTILLHRSNDVKASHIINKRQHCFLLIKFIDSILVFFPVQYV